MKIELYHDILAKKVYEKASADEKMRLKIERFIRERYDFYRESQALMTANDLDYVTPYLEKVLLPPEQLDFIRESRREVAADERRRRRRNLVIGSVLAIAAIVSIVLAIQANQKTEEARRANEETQEALTRAQQEKDRADLKAEEAEQERNKALDEKQRADQEAREAEAARNDALEAQQIAQQKEREAIASAQAAEDSAAVAKAQRLAAFEAQQTAQEKEKEATEALDKLNTTRIQVVDVLIEQADELILALDYAAARTKLNTAADLVSRYIPLGQAFMELAFFYGESYQFTKAEESLKKAAGLFGRPAVSAKVQQNADTLIYLNNFRDGLAELDSVQFRKLEHRYYPDMVTVAGGTFEMGCKEGKDGDCKDDETLHTVNLSTFQIARTETTVWQYYLYCEVSKNDNIQRTRESWGLVGDNPVVNINWYDALGYANWLSGQRGRQAVYTIDKTKKDTYNVSSYDDLKWLITVDSMANGYRLPTEAEWEYAARGGQKSKGYPYSGSGSIDSVAWYDDNAQGRTQSVRQKKANELGVKHMSGNAWEWCWDWYGDYDSEITQDPKGPDSGSGRVLRGGSWSYDAASARVALRADSDFPVLRDYSLGFRLARAVR